MKWWSSLGSAGFLAGLVVTLGACVPQPGHAALTLEGDRSGNAAGPGVTCPHVTSVSATWMWSGSVGGRAVSITAAALNASGIPSALLINSENTSWQAAAPGQASPEFGVFTARVEEGKVLHIDGIAKSQSQGTGPIKIRGAMRCPLD
ncbi:MAG TPA: hypothetical protein VK524_08890 [Polyangiaceae bacterium]|nr:hypothetical protein [Polyangiaceae bacterium]